MVKKMKIQIIFFLLLLLIACTTDDQIQFSGTVGDAWSIPKEEVISGAGKDAIAAIDTPVFSEADQIAYLQDDDRVLVMKIGQMTRAYPLNILNWHEIVNDEIAEKSITISYCPLTGTGISWDRQVDGTKTTFGVSGLLHHSNLIAFDRDSDSYWSQVRTDCVHGSLIGRRLRHYSMIEMPWSSLQHMIPDAEILTEETGFDLPYSSYPYYDYRTNHDLFLVPVEFDDNRLPAKEKVFGIIVQNEAKVYPFTAFEPDRLNIINEVFRGQPIVILCHPGLGFTTAYKSNIDGQVLNFLPVRNDENIVMIDHQGHTWNLFGEDTDSQDHIRNLSSLKSMSGYWFAWTKFFPRVEIYRE